MPSFLYRTYRVNAAGCVMIPAEARRLLGIRPGDMMEVSIDGEEIVMRKFDPEQRIRVSDQGSSSTG